MQETKLNNLEINELTQAQYESAKAAGTIDSDALYMTEYYQEPTEVTSISKGGTNATNASEARVNLGFEYGENVPTHVPATGDGAIYFKTETAPALVTPIEEGGTNAVTAEGARANLGITPIVTKSITQSFTGATDWFYTGVAVTIPANCIYGIKAEAIYSNSKPNGVGIGYNNTAKTGILEWTHETEFWFYQPTVSSTGITTVESTYYIWAKYSAAGTSNRVNVSYWYKSLV